MAKEYFTEQSLRGDWGPVEAEVQRAGLHHGRRGDSHERQTESGRWQPEPPIARRRELPALERSVWPTLFLSLQVFVEELDGLLQSLIELLTEPAVSFAFHGYELGMSVDLVQC